MVPSKHRIWLWSLPLAAVSLGLISVAGVRGWRQPYDGLGWSSANSTISAIAPGGPATTADIQVGDTVVAVNGIPVHEIASLYGGQAAGDRVTYTLLRNGQRGSPAGSLEQHMFDEVGRAAEGRGFIAGTAVDPHPDGNGSDMPDLLGDYLDPVIHDGFAVHARPVLPSGSTGSCRPYQSQSP